jgi:transcriptional regulator with XRE-family HTH domain
MKSIHTAEYRSMLASLRQAREAAGLTQARVADELGRPQSFVSKCESGERRIDVTELATFARLYGQPVTYFLNDRAGPPGSTRPGAVARDLRLRPYA